jgi:hypothetical protein
VTVLLRSGDRTAGSLASFDTSTVDIRDEKGQRRLVQWNDVVLLDFADGGRVLPWAEADHAQQNAQTIVLRDGGNLRGRILDFVDEGGPEAAVVFDATGQGHVQIELREVARIYVHAFSTEAMTTAGFPSTLNRASAMLRQTPEGAFVVPGNTRWINTAITARRGERFDVQTGGTVYLQSDSRDEARPAGSLSGRLAAGYPIPDQVAGILIGRIGERGVPFGIGDRMSFVSPDGGDLYLGINDDDLSDNSGAFTIRIVRSRRPR